MSTQAANNIGDLEIYQAAKGGKITIMMMLDTSGSMDIEEYSLACDLPKGVTSQGVFKESSTTDKNISEKHPLYYKVEGTVHELFPFDPNTADSTQLLKLGLQSWQVRSIYKFRAKGGIFREKTDFARLYGLTKKQYEVLAPTPMKPVALAVVLGVSPLLSAVSKPTLPAEISASAAAAFDLTM